MTPGAERFFDSPHDQQALGAGVTPPRPVSRGRPSPLPQSARSHGSPGSGGGGGGFGNPQESGADTDPDNLLRTQAVSVKTGGAVSYRSPKEKPTLEFVMPVPPDEEHLSVYRKELKVTCWT